MALSQKDQAAVKKAGIAGGLSVAKATSISQGGGSDLPAARGNEFAGAFEQEMHHRGMNPEDTFRDYSVTGLTDYFAGQATLQDAAISSNSFGASEIQIPQGPNAPNFTNYGGTGGTASSAWAKALTPPIGAVPDANGIYTYTAENTAPQKEGGESQSLQTDLETLLKNIPQKESLFQNQQYIQAEQERVRAKQKQDQISNQITSIVNQAQASALSITGQGRGIPEAIIGGQQAQIYKEAAIQALPLQAQLAVAQNDYEAATEHLESIGQMVSEQISNNYQYAMKRYDSIKDFVTKDEDRRLKQLETEETRAYNTQQDNLNFAQSLASEAFKNGQGSVGTGLMRVMQNPADPLFLEKVGRIAGQIQPKATGGSASQLIEGAVALTPEDKRMLTGAGLSSADITNVQNDIAQHGIEAVLAGVTDPAQKAAIQKTYGVTPKITREQIASSITLKTAQEGLKETYTDDELKQLSIDNGFASFWKSRASELEDFLNSDKAKQLYIDLQYKQYQDAGMAE